MNGIMSSAPLSKKDLAELAKYDTPTICNAIELFDVRPRNVGYMDDRIKACFPEMPPMVGYASTATFRSADTPQGADAYSGMGGQLADFEELPGPPVVVFQDLDNPTRAATFGEVMCTVYKTFGAVGLITSGAARDLDQVRDIGFPTFSNGAICAHGYCTIMDVHVSVHVGGITLYPGDLLHGDCNGVATIPLEIASEVAGACQGVVEAEDIVLSYLKSGEATAEGLSEARRACQAAVDRLAAQLRR